VRDEEAALDIVQDSMMKLAEHYGDKPLDELPMLFQRILSNCTLDWFRRKRRATRCFPTWATSNPARTREISICWKLIPLPEGL
jgi:RNA polymerase sigma-70 factor (ECF subfamily)